MNEPVIMLDHLSKSYGNVHAVQDLSLQIERGTIFGFLGPNGAGKTTTIRMLCGLTHPSGGHATIESADVWKDRQQVRTKFGYVPQRFSLYRDLTVDFLAARMVCPAPSWSKEYSACCVSSTWEKKEIRRRKVFREECANCWRSVAH